MQSSARQPKGATERRAMFTTMIQQLTRPEAFAAIEAESLAHTEIVQTHASVVLLTSVHAYKLKKPENLGFLDYSTPKLRRHFCQEEVRLNTPLAPDIYRGVTAIIRLPDGHFRFTCIYRGEDLPNPGESVDGGHIVDFAVVMLRVPEDATFDALLHSGQLTAALLGEAAHTIATFHHLAPSDEGIMEFGNPEIVGRNWEENLSQMQPFIGRTLNQETYDHIATFAHDFMRQRVALFEDRVRKGCIRDCHGDLRLQHIYRLDAGTEAAPHLAILDRIEFNERFRYGDVASEVAFLAMDLEIAGRADLARNFVNAYVAESGDEALLEMLPFYTCYRACVRGKVLSFLLDQPDVSSTEHDKAARQAAASFELASWHASTPTGAVLIMLGGLMGTGKSTIADALHKALGWPMRSADRLRKSLVGIDPQAPQESVFGQGIYSSAWTKRTYQALGEEADALLQAGHSVILDASFIRQRDRIDMAMIAQRHSEHVLFVECIAPQAVIMERLSERWTRRTAGTTGTTGTTGNDPAGDADASDGRPELYKRQRALWEPVPVGSAPLGEHATYLQLDTSQPLAQCIERLFDAAGISQLACWLPSDPNN